MAGLDATTHGVLILLPFLGGLASVAPAVALQSHPWSEDSLPLGRSPQLLAQVIPTAGATQTQVSTEAAAGRFEINGGLQAGSNLFHRFDQLDLATGETANFLTQPSIEAIFSQIGGPASSIDGLLQVSGSNADLFVINPSGILFGPNAQLDLSGSFTATTADHLGFGDQWLDLSEEGFNAETVLADELTAVEFSAATGGLLENQGTLNVNPGQAIGLLGTTVVNSGSLVAPGGDINLFAAQNGQRLSLGGGLLNVELPTQLSQESATSGLFLAESAAGALTEATGLQLNVDGSTSLAAGTNVVRGRVDVSSVGEAGGQVKLLGNVIRLDKLVVDASGGQGGSVLVGGDRQGQGDLLRASQVQIDQGSVLRADALGSGQGGRAVVWSDGVTQVAGTVTATAQVGEGGFIETSGKQTLSIEGASVDASSLQGQGGDWLLDPSDIVIQTGGLGVVADDVFDPGTTGAPSIIDPNTIETALDGGTNVTITTTSGSGGNGDITLNSSIDQVGAGNAALTLTARRFNLNAGSQIDLTSAGGLIFNLNQVNPEVNAPIQSIQNAVDAIGTVNGSRLINLGAGTYQGATVPSLLTLDKDVTIQGADRTNTFLTGGNTARVVEIAPGANVTLRTLEIRDGQTIATESGAGILNQGNLTLDNVLLQQNIAGLDGGAIDSSLASSRLVLIEETGIFNNQAGRNGGGLSLGGDTQILQAGVVSNTAGSDGGGIYNTGSAQMTNLGLVSNNAARGAGLANIGTASSATISIFGISQNISTAEGGGILNELGQVSLTDGSVTLNESGASGGGIGSNGTLVLNRVRVGENRSPDFGGGLRLGGNSIATLTAVDFDANETGDAGGAISADSATDLTIRDSVFQNNRSDRFAGAINTNTGLGRVQIQGATFANNIAATEDGGAIYAETDILIEDVTFAGNVAGDEGGAIANERNTAQLTIRRSDFTKNSATNGGGAIKNFGQAQLEIIDTDFSENSAANGGAIDNLADAGSLTISAASRFTSNQATNDGGAIRNQAASLDISASEFRGNEAGNSGGAIHSLPTLAGGTLSVAGSTFSNNSAEQAGALDVGSSAVVTVSRSTLAGNRANQQGGAIRSAGDLELTNVTIANNIADADGDAIGLAGGIAQEQGNVRLQNTIVAQNQGAIAADLSGTFQDLGNNLIGISDGATGFSSSTLVGTQTAPIAPVLSPLGDYGGLTQSLAILPGSPAIDAAGISSALDQRGVAEVGNGPDIGAFESQGFSLTGQSGMGQSTEVNTTFVDPLTLEIISPAGDPVDGGQITFMAPTSGASTSFAPVSTTVDIAGGTADLVVGANAIVGSYDVQATANGLADTVFALTNTPSTTPPTPTIDPPVTPPPATDPPAPPVPPTEPVPDPPMPTVQVPVTPSDPITTPTVLPAEPQVVLAEPDVPQTVASPPEVTSSSVVPASIDLPANLPANIALAITDGERDGENAQLDDEAALSIGVGTSLSLSNGQAITDLDATFSSQFLTYFQSTVTEDSPLYRAQTARTQSGGGSTVSATQALLNQAEEAHGARSAVLYALFVPPATEDDSHFGAAQAASMALTRRQQNQTESDEDQLMLVLVPSDSQPVQRLVNVTRRELHRQAKLFRMAVADPADHWSYRPLAQQMHGWLFAPIASELEHLNLDHVMYSLAPGLRTIPLAAMMDGDDFVVEQYGISLIPSVDLLETDFGSSPPAPQTVVAGASEFEQLSDLPAVAVELDAIASQRESVVVLLNEAFTQQQILDTQNNNNTKTLHLATHAEFKSGNLENSYLQFWDEKLKFSDLSKLGWRDLELLILSACETAISSPEAELGFAGLAAATGVESSIGSLWSVSDLGTLALMAEFYGQLSQEPLRFQALRQTQIAMLRGETQISEQRLQTERGEITLPQDWSLNDSVEFTHPFYWSGFSLVGNPWW